MNPLARLPLLLLAVAVAGLDQWSKALVLAADARRALPFRVAGCLDIVQVLNRGVTFGILSDHQARLVPYVLAFVAGLAVVMLLGVVCRSGHFVPASCAALIAGGAFGNVIDRLRFGAVVDFIDFHVGRWSWYVFNVGDSCIVAGVVLWISWSLFLARPAQDADASGSME